MSLTVAPFQPFLPGMEDPLPKSAPGLEDELDWQRDRRDGATWLKSTIAYCEWRSGRALRPWRDRGERQLRDEYTYAIHLLMTLLHAPADEAQQGLQLVLPQFNIDTENPPYTLEELELAEKPVSQLVEELQALNPQLKLRRSLLHLRRNKLARMVLQARADFREADRRVA